MKTLRILAWALALAFLFTVLWLAAYLVSLPKAEASEEHMRLYHADAQHDQWMRSLKRPDTGTSCCSLLDCRPVDAEWRDGQWWAMIRGAWMAIPPEKVVHSPLSIDGEPWACYGDTTLFCFVPPISGY